MQDTIKIRRIDTREQLQELARELGVRHDWHEPDEQEVTVSVQGQSFDNAGFWGKWFLDSTAADREAGRFVCDAEFFVTIFRDKEPVAEVNLATLFAMACGTID
jgi:hypothetical protein